MKKYIGTKQVEAEPMTMGEAYEKGLLQAGRVPKGFETQVAGYHVRYQDGYESWSPAAPFEAAYHEGDMGDVSDGYHTFNELYRYRMLYNAAFFNELARQGKVKVCKSHRHSDGELCFGGGWFIVMAELPTGQISNHYEDKDWDLFDVPELEVSWEWDGHSPNEAADRIEAYLKSYQNKTFLDRLYIELSDLNGKYDRLNGFLDSDTFKNLPPTSRALLKAQHGVMSAYIQILSERIRTEECRSGEAHQPEGTL